MSRLRRHLGNLGRLLARAARPVPPGLFERTEPVSRLFGLDRGTAVDRHYIEGFLAAHAGAIRGRVLEVAETAYTRRFGGERVTAAEVLHAGPGSPANALVGDLTRPETLPEGRYDCFVCTQTLNVIFRVEDALRGAHRVLAPGGALLATAPGISQVSRYDLERWGDYWRFTPMALERLAQPLFERVEVKAYGNLLAATAFLHGVALEELPHRALLDNPDPDYPMLIGLAAWKAG